MVQSRFNDLGHQYEGKCKVLGSFALVTVERRNQIGVVVNSCKAVQLVLLVQAGEGRFGFWKPQFM